MSRAQATEGCICSTTEIEYRDFIKKIRGITEGSSVQKKGVRACLCFRTTTLSVNSMEEKLKGQEARKTTSVAGRKWVRA